jgi:hypothetical protein
MDEFVTMHHCSNRYLMSMERPCGSVSRTNSDTRWSNGSSGSISWNPRSRSARGEGGKNEDDE